MPVPVLLLVLVGSMTGASGAVVSKIITKGLLLKLSLPTLSVAVT